MIRVAVAVLLFAAFGWAQHPDDAFVGQKAPDISGELWINSTPLKIADLRGKVVLVDFWAFDCPNCAEAMPYVKKWHEKYSKNGLVIVGVHTPRIDYEKDVESVKKAVKHKGILYPVTIDNKYKVWSDYLCAAWPTHFVVDQEGVIQLSHTGVGRYEDTERVIQKLLARKAK